MQQIERYGVIALVFMAVTVVAVYLWDDGEQEPLEETARAGAVHTGLADRGRSPDRPVPEHAPVRPRTRETLPLSDPGTDVAARPAGPAAPAGSAASGAARGGPAESTPGAALLGAGEPQPRGAELDVFEPEGALFHASRDRARSRESAPARTESAAPRTESPAPRTATRVEPEPAPASSAAAAPATYVVQQGETLGEISLRLLGTSKRWREIQELNGGLDPRQVRAGQELKLPRGASAAPGRATPPELAAETKPAPAAATKRAPAAEPPKVASGPTYSVRQGDMLSSIALRELGDAAHWPKIAAANPGLDPDHLVAGMKLVLPEVERAPERPSPEPRSTRVADAKPQESRYKVR